MSKTVEGFNTGIIWKLWYKLTDDIALTSSTKGLIKQEARSRTTNSEATEMKVSSETFIRRKDKW